MNENLNGEKIEGLLLEYLARGYNDYDEEIMSFEIGKDEIIIQTEFSVTVKVSERSARVVRANRDKQLKLITKKLENDNFIDAINFNYVSGFYCMYFEGLDLDDFLNNCDFYTVDGGIQIDFQMEYFMNRHEMELLFMDYKRCA